MQCDVLIVGCGPAGGQCARQLAAAGHKVLMVDQAREFSDNDYSSGGTILSFLTDFNIPDAVVGAYWQHLVVHSDQNVYEWKTNEKQGVILDFAKLKQFLVNETLQAGGQCQLGVKYQSHKILSDGSCEVTLLDRCKRETFTVKTQLIVDATGSTRAVIGKKPKQDYLQAYGQEYLIETKLPSVALENRMVFMLGKSWVPDGYTWIFPMGNRRYKVGAAIFQLRDKMQKVNIKQTIEAILERFFQDNAYTILDKHGGDVWYCHPRKQSFFNNNVVAIGDSVSAINALGGEGIRHGMVCADYAAQAIDAYFKTNNLRVFKHYRKQFLRYVKYKWWFCEVYAKRYYDFDKTNTDALLKRLESKPYSVMKALLFDYDFMLIIKRYSKHRFMHLKNFLFNR